MTELQKIINWADAELQKLFHALPAVVKKYGTEGLHIGNVIKEALASKDAIAVEALLAKLIPGTWEADVINAINKALSITIPALTGIVEHADLPLADQANAFMIYLKGLSPKMQHAAICKQLSGIFQALDPHLTEVGADSAAQLLYAHVTVQHAA